MSKINELIQTLCPDGVEYKKLGVTCNMKAGKAVAASDISSEYSTATPYPCYGGNGIRGFVSMCSHSGEFPIIGRQGALCGNINYATGDFYATEHAVVVESRGEYNQKFLKYLLIAMDLNQYKSKGAQPGLAVGNIEKIVAPVPPRPVQEEIVRILDEYTDLEAELEAKLSEEIELKQKQYEYCASKLFEDLNVEYISMSELAKFKYGYTDKASDSGNARFIRITDIDDFGELSSEDEKYITLTDDAEKYLLTKGSLVVARTGATYGKTLYFDSDEPSVYASFLIKIDFDNNQVLNRYYWHFTKTSLYWEQANKYVKVGGQQQFNSPALGRVCVPVPSPTEQERIVKTLDKYDTYTRDMISTLNTELESRKKQYAYYRDKLLTFKRKEV